MPFTAQHQIGALIKTADGCWGIVRAVTEQAGGTKLELDLLSDPGSSSSASRSVVVVKADSIEQLPVCAAGTCVLTTVGSGVVLRYEHRSDLYVVRLWQPRGMGSSVAFLNRASLLQPLTASTGLKVLTPYGRGTVVSIATNPTRLRVDLGYGIGYLQPDSVTCPVAAVMPLVEVMVDRSTALVQHRLRAAKQSGAARSLMEGLSALEPLTAQARAMFAASTSSSAAAAAAAAAATAAATESAPSLVDALVRAAEDPAATASLRSMLEARGAELDELLQSARTTNTTTAAAGDTTAGAGELDFELLLRNGKARIDALLSESAALITGQVQTRLATDKLPSLEEGLSELRRFAESASSSIVSSTSTSTNSRSSSSAAAAALADSALRGLAAEATAAVAAAQRASAELAGTRTAAVLRQGREALGAQLEAALAQQQQDPAVAAAVGNSNKLLTSLTVGDSPTVLKAKELAEKARARLDARGGLQGVVAAASGSNSSSDSSSSALVGKARQLEERGKRRVASALRSAAREGEKARNVVALLRGDSSVSVSDQVLKCTVYHHVMLLLQLAVSAISTSCTSCSGSSHGAR
jgi:hypothetical protein